MQKSEALADNNNNDAHTKTELSSIPRPPQTGGQQYRAVLFSSEVLSSSTSALASLNVKLTESIGVYEQIHSSPAEM